MTEDNNTGTDATEGQSNGDESAVIKALRKQIKDLEASKVDPATIRAETRSELEREYAIKAKLESFKLPAGISKTVSETLGEAELNDETFLKALTDIGFKVEATDGGSDQTDQNAQQQGDLAGIASLSAQVQSAAGAAAPATAVEAVNQAKNREELIEAARKGGFLSE